jgi:ADP-ribose pyrophosphatase YjhB (NUDIX family)
MTSPNKTNLTLQTPDGIFSYRVGAIIIHDGKILMVKNHDTPFPYTVGGRVKFGESSRETLLREVFEETGVEFEIDRLVFINENFFTTRTDGEICHEIALFYLMKPNPLAGTVGGMFVEEYGEVSFHWLPIDGLDDIRIYPEFFKTDLKQIPENTVHYVTGKDDFK